MTSMAADGVRAVLLTALALLPWSKIEAVGTSYRGTPPTQAVLLNRLASMGDLGRMWLVVLVAGVALAASLAGPALRAATATATASG